LESWEPQQLQQHDLTQLPTALQMQHAPHHAIEEIMPPMANCGGAFQLKIIGDQHNLEIVFFP
jgi:hypothetical protein